MYPEQVNMSGALPFRGYMNPVGNYLSLVDCMDTSADITGSYPTPMGGGVYGCGPMSMCGSIMPGMGFPGFCGYGPGYECMNMTIDQYMDKMNELEGKGIDWQVARKHKLENAEFNSKAQNNVITDRIAVLHGLIEDNNQDQVLGAYEELKQVVSDKYQAITGRTPDAKQVDAMAKELYYTKVQKNIGDDLREYGDSPFWSGAKKAAGFGLGWLLMDGTTATDNIATVEGRKVPTKDKVKEVFGGVVSGVLTLGALILGGVLLKKGLKVRGGHSPTP